MILVPGQQRDLSKTPLAINPSGIPPNFDDPPSLAGTLCAVGATLLFLSAIFVVIRLATNYRVIGKLGIADCESRFQLEIAPVHSWLNKVNRFLSFCIHFDGMLLCRCCQR